MIPRETKMYNRKRNDIALARRQESAADRALEYSSLSPQQKLARLDARLGKDVGAVKERARLRKMVEDGVTAPDKGKIEEVFGKGKSRKNGNS
jgi:hypothetical protein